MTKTPNLAYEPVVGFQSEKAAQISAFFISESGGRIDKLKLAKLQYLAEREFLARHGRPMTYDELYSLPHGPICSGALNGIEGKLGDRSEWSRITRHGVRDVYGDKELNREAFDMVSDAEFAVLHSIWQGFGHLTATALRGFTHNARNCPEYTEIEGARVPISYRDILQALGNPNAVSLSDRIEELRRLELSFRA